MFALFVCIHVYCVYICGYVRKEVYVYIYTQYNMREGRDKGERKRDLHILDSKEGCVVMRSMTDCCRGQGLFDYFFNTFLYVKILRSNKLRLSVSRRIAGNYPPLISYRK